MREGGFALEIYVADRAISERNVDGRAVAHAVAGAAFEVVLTNDNHGDYLVRLFVDGFEVDPGYLKRVRGRDTARFRGFVCKRDVHEFLFAKTPIDDTREAASEQTCIGEVSAVIFATRRVRMEESSDEDDPVRRSSAHIRARALPEKTAVKEYGVQARAGGAIEQMPQYRRRRSGDYRLEKVTPEVATMKLLYRDSFWFARNCGDPLIAAHNVASSPVPAGLRTVSGVGQAAPAAASMAAAPTAAADTSTARAGSSSSAVKHEQRVKYQEQVKHETASLVKVDFGAAEPWFSQKVAKPLARRAPGETARGPDGKRRLLSKAGVVQQPQEVVILSD